MPPTIPVMIRLGDFGGEAHSDLLVMRKKTYTACFSGLCWIVTHMVRKVWFVEEAQKRLFGRGEERTEQ